MQILNFCSSGFFCLFVCLFFHWYQNFPGTISPATTSAVPDTAAPLVVPGNPHISLLLSLGLKSELKPDSPVDGGIPLSWVSVRWWLTSPSTASTRRSDAAMNGYESTLFFAAMAAGLWVELNSADKPFLLFSGFSSWAKFTSAAVGLAALAVIFVVFITWKRTKVRTYAGDAWTWGFWVGTKLKD